MSWRDTRCFFPQFVRRKAACTLFETTTATRGRPSPSPFQIQLFIYSPSSVLNVPLSIRIFSVFKLCFPPCITGVFFHSCQFLFFVLLLKLFSEIEDESFNQACERKKLAARLCEHYVRASSFTSVVSKVNFETKVSTLVFIDVI